MSEFNHEPADYSMEEQNRRMNDQSQSEPQGQFQNGPQNQFNQGQYQGGPQNQFNQGQFQGGPQNQFNQGQFQNGPQGQYYAAPGQKVVTVDKNLHVWVWCFLLGGLGIDRFIRGQVGIGICKLLLGWLTFGIWPLVDWIIAMVEAYGSSFGSDREFVFIDGKYAK